MTAVMEKAINALDGLTDEQVEQVIFFAMRMKADNKVTDYSSVIENADLINQKRKIGFMADSFISISSDFDTCLDGLEDYV